MITIPTARSGSSILDGDDLDAALDSGAVPWLRAKPGGGGGKGRSFSPVQSVLSGGVSKLASGSVACQLLTHL